MCVLLFSHTRTCRVVVRTSLPVHVHWFMFAFVNLGYVGTHSWIRDIDIYTCQTYKLFRTLYGRMCFVCTCPCVCTNNCMRTCMYMHSLIFKSATNTTSCVFAFWQICVNVVVKSVILCLFTLCLPSSIDICVVNIESIKIDIRCLYVIQLRTFTYLHFKSMSVCVLAWSVHAYLHVVCMFNLSSTFT